MVTRLGLWVLQGLGYLPLTWLRALGAGLGRLLLLVIPSRRRVVQTNLRVCFPHLSDAQRDALVHQTFVYFAQ
jgi:KDO2-lipid IV(A) lauroyltransferase